ncbi:MAG: ABC transporter ATP-binding protein [Deltaproteobacteria bacterium]|nr:ABC transporter ATP-binding protein [Deltaproteobacteria bacterium]
MRSLATRRKRRAQDWDGEAKGVSRFVGVFRYTGRAVKLVWSTHRGLTVALFVLSLVAGFLPASIAYTGKLIVDAVVKAAESGAAADRTMALVWVGVELGLVALVAGAQRGLEVSRQLLRALLGQRVNEMILERALELELSDFEDPEIYDKMTRARREASSRPLSLVSRAFGLIQANVSLVAYLGLLLSFSPWAVALLAVAALPAFVAETRFSDDAFRLFKWRAPESRKQMYLETVLAREDYAKEVKLFGIGPILMDRYRAIFDTVYAEDRKLALRRGGWGFLLGLLGTGALYGAYGWVAWETVATNLTLGDMTMYLLVFKQGQAALTTALSSIGGMYEDNLYLSNLYEFLEHESDAIGGTATEGTKPGDGLRLENVGFSYPGATAPAVEGIDLHVAPGTKLALVGSNGAGKTTLIKLIAGLYRPTAGRVLFDGRPLDEWEPNTLRQKIGVIFQDFVRYQLTVGENVGAGDVTAFEDAERWSVAAEKGMADEFIERLPGGFDTQLGKWFAGGQELSGGQWQKLALARSFMREGAELLILDEPTAAMDAEAEAEIFERFRQLTEDRMAILISHRFSTVRMADRIVVLERGQIIEDGSHETLLDDDGRYAHLFALQAAGYS